MHEEAHNIISQILDNMGITFHTIEVSEREWPPATCFSVKTDESGILIGNHGETLHALNHLFSRILSHRNLNYDKKTLIDINDYYDKKNESVKTKASILAERARFFKHDVEMDPAGSYERMLIHSLFADTKDILTESTGEGKYRRVVIRYQGENNPSVLNGLE
mgnify:CR=1 FL=1